MIESEIPKFTDTSPESQTFAEFKQIYQIFDHGSYQELPIPELADRMEQVSLQQYGVEMNRQLLVTEIVKDRVLNSPSASDALNSLSQVRDELNFDQKVFVISTMGAAFGSDYNYDRRDTGLDEKGVITFDQLLAAHQNNLLGGVCRYIANAQALMMRAMGVDQAYIISYATRGGGQAKHHDRDGSKRSRSCRQI